MSEFFPLIFFKLFVDLSFNSDNYIKKNKKKDEILFF